MLTSAEYGYIIRHRTSLQQEIDAAEAEKEQYDGLKKAAQDRKDFLKAEMTFYTNFLKEALEEYEAAHPLDG